MQKKYLVQILAVVFFFSAGNVGANTTILNFKKLNENMYRGGSPTGDGVDQLHALGIRTILDLQTTDGVIEAEKEKTANYGMNFYSVELPALMLRPSEERIQKILSILSDARNFPIYIHCRHGEDRTGLVVGLYRALLQKWPAEIAYSEMLANNFHPQWMKGLDCTFREMTGMQVPHVCSLIPVWTDDDDLL